jgi:hypothetical protein
MKQPIHQTTFNSNNAVNSHNTVLFNFHPSGPLGAALLAFGMLLGTPSSVAPATFEPSALVEQHTRAAPDTQVGPSLKQSRAEPSVQQLAPAAPHTQIRPLPKESGAQPIARPSRKSCRCRR